jgi:hypothetical protein
MGLSDVGFGWAASLICAALQRLFLASAPDNAVEAAQLATGTDVLDLAV